MKRALVLAAFLAFAPSVHAEVKDGTPEEVKADFDMICDVVKRSHADQEKDPSKKAAKLADYLLSHLKTRQALHTMQSLAGELPADKPRLLKKAAADAGHRGPCPFADEK